MTTAVMPHPRRPREIHLNQLPKATATELEHLLDQAEQHADRREMALYQHLHAQAIQLIGIQPPTDGELARCTCQGCYCDTIFDARHARYYVSGTVEFVQCPGCDDDHRIYSD